MGFFTGDVQKNQPKCEKSMQMMDWMSGFPLFDWLRTWKTIRSLQFDRLRTWKTNKSPLFNWLRTCRKTNQSVSSSGYNI